jgi:hypothetical protein
VHAADPGHAPQPAHDLGADGDPLGLGGVAGAAPHAGERRVVDLDAGDLVVHVLQHPDAARRVDADEQWGSLGDPGGHHGLQPSGEPVDVVDDVALEQVQAGVELPLQPLHRVDQRVRRPDDPERRAGREAFAGEQLARVEAGDEPDHAERVEVAHVSGERLVPADSQRVAAERHHGADAERPGAEEVALRRHRVAVAPGDLQDRFDAFPQE